MESWMKRGFLQNSKSDSKSIASKGIIQADRRPEVVVNPQNKQQEPPGPPSIKLKIPCGPNDFGDFTIFPSVGDFPATLGKPARATVTKLPSHGTPYTVSLLYPGAKEAIEAIPGFPTPYLPSLRVNYRIGDVPGAGKGMFAITDLNAGDVILRERPLCLIPQCLGDETMTVRQMNLTILAMMESMDPRDNWDFCELTTCKPGPPGNPIIGIISTNALTAACMPGGYNGRYIGICRDLCRVNHRSGATHWRLERLTTTTAACQTQLIDYRSKTWCMNSVPYAL